MSGADPFAIDASKRDLVQGNLLDMAREALARRAALDEPADRQLARTFRCVMTDVGQMYADPAYGFAEMLAVAVEMLADQMGETP